MKKLSVLVVVISMFLITCMNDSETFYPNAGSQKFWARNTVTGNFYQVNAERLASNSRCEVWAENGSGVTEATAGRIAYEYENNIYVNMMNTFGYKVPDMNNMNTMEIAHYLATGKDETQLTILLLDIKDGYKTKDDPYVGGYFIFIDLLGNNPKYSAYSNKRDMIYIDTDPSFKEKNMESIYTTLAHEMQHLMNFVSSFVYRLDEEKNTLYQMDTWIDEGLSSAAEWVYSKKHPEERWRYYNVDPSKLIAKGNNFYIWDNHKKESTYANLDDYATVYLFFQYLRLQSNNPDKIYSDIQKSKFYNYQAVTSAKSINSAHNDKWSLLLRDWHAANYTNSASSLYGYKNDSVLKVIKAPMFPGGTTTVNLYPGEGVYSKTTTAESVPKVSGNIYYSGLSASGADPNDVTGFANGARLTYNVDTETDIEKAVSVPGSTTGIAPGASVSISSGSRSAQISSAEKFTGPFKVDAGYFLRRNGNNGVHDIEIKNIFNGNNSRSVTKNGNILKFDISTVERVLIDE